MELGIWIEGEVRHGRQLGRELGFPTANLDVADESIPGGVYLSRVVIDGQEYRAVSNLGSNPSVGGGVRHLETHVIGFTGNLYGRVLRVELLRKLRDERRFATLEELRAQIEQDCRMVMNA